MSYNTNLRLARVNKNDEFYTKLEDIENNLYHFQSEFQNKIIYCNCDDYHTSNFYKYFSNNFHNFKLKKLICTAYQKDNHGFGIIQTQENKKKFILNEDGSFDSKECIDILSKSDIIVTNPPFSLFKKYMQVIFDSGKSFIVLGHLNGACYQNVFQHFIENKIHIFGKGNYSFISNDKIQNLANIRWFTNLSVLCHKKLNLTETYTPEKYLRYFSHDAINVDKVKDIPKDYDDLMGVPNTFLDYYNPKQFEIVGICKKWSIWTELNEKIKNYKEMTEDGIFTGFTGIRKASPFIEGLPPRKGHYYINDQGHIIHEKYVRIFIKRK